jgi:hypothetical protein
MRRVTLKERIVPKISGHLRQSGMVLILEMPHTESINLFRALAEFLFHFSKNICPMTPSRYQLDIMGPKKLKLKNWGISQSDIYAHTMGVGLLKCLAIRRGQILLHNVPSWIH